MKSQVSLVAAVAAVIMFVVSGCGNNQQSLWDQIKQLGSEKTELKLQVEKLQAENKQLAQQVETLSVLSPELRLDAIPTVEKIELGKRCGIYDKDRDGIKEKLIVYVCPLDRTADTIKTPGRVTVQLWNLNSNKDKALIAKWQIEPAELIKLWSGTLMTNYYRLKFDVRDLLDGSETELTIKVDFTDYVTGKLLSAQRVIKP